MVNDRDDGKPGWFEEELEFPSMDSSLPEPKLYFADDLRAVYTAFRDQVYNPRSVLYPSCGFDASPARVFDNVTFVDLEDGNEGCVGKLQEAGFNALSQDIRTYTPKDLHDLLILLNPSIPTEWASRHLKSGGYVLANNYHGNASEMYKQPDRFTLEGSIDFVEPDRRKEDNRVVVSRNLEGLFEPVKDSLEFEELRPSEFEFTKGMVDSFAEQGIIDVDPNAPFEEKWAVYREQMGQGMPSKKVAEKYIFVKK
jgi:hypothetical protein